MNLVDLQDLFKQFNSQYFGSRLQISPIEFKKDFPEGVMGSCECKPNRILIREGLCDSQQRVTLLHEMIHRHLGHKDHERDFQTELVCCAKSSDSIFRKAILSELQRVRDINHYGFNNQDSLLQSVLLQLAIEHQGRSWNEIEQSAFQAINEAISTPLNAKEFAKLKGKLSGIWDSICDGSISQPPTPQPFGQQKKSV